MKRNYFYLRLSLSSRVALAGFVERIGSIGYCQDSGLTTAKSPSSTWIELRVERAADIASLRLELARSGVESSVEEIVEIRPGEGKVQAKQLELFAGAL